MGATGAGLPHCLPCPQQVGRITMPSDTPASNASATRIITNVSFISVAYSVARRRSSAMQKGCRAGAASATAEASDQAFFPLPECSWQGYVGRRYC